MKRPHFKLPSSLARFAMSGDKTATDKPVPTGTQKQIRPVISSIGDTINLLESSDFEDVEDAEDTLPPAFKRLLEPLKLTKDAFTKYSRDFTNVAEAEKDTATAESSKGSIIVLASKAEKLYNVCKTAIRPGADDKSALERYTSAVEDPVDRVEVLTQAILKGALKDIAKEPYITAAEVQALKDALEKVKKLPASLPDSNAEAGQHTYNNHGGTFNIKHGPGNQNINTGTGQIFDGGNNFPGNVYFGGPSPPPVSTKPGS